MNYLADRPRLTVLLIALLSLIAVIALTSALAEASEPVPGGAVGVMVSMDDPELPEQGMAADEIMLHLDLEYMDAQRLPSLRAAEEEGVGYVPGKPLSTCAVHNVPRAPVLMDLSADPWEVQGGSPYLPAQLAIPAVKAAFAARYGALCSDGFHGGRFHCASEARSPTTWKQRMEDLCRLQPEGYNCKATQKEVLDAIANCAWWIHQRWAQKIGNGVPERAVRYSYPVDQVPCSLDGEPVCLTQSFPWEGMVTCYFNTNPLCGPGVGGSDPGPEPVSDKDGDGIPDDLDNCPNVPNADQANLDADGKGDVCDADRDGDGVRNAADDCPDLWNPEQLGECEGGGSGAEVVEVRVSCRVEDGAAVVRLEGPGAPGVAGVVEYRPGIKSTGSLRLVVGESVSGTVCRWEVR